MLWPAAKRTDLVIGIDKHTMDTGNNTHSYIGLLYLWHTPKFPSSNVFINGQPALGVGAMGYSLHNPQGKPLNPDNRPYWIRYLTNIAMSLCLMMLTTIANMALAGILSFMPRTQNSDRFVQDVTGIDISDRRQIWRAISNNLKQYTQWQTWIKLLIPPLPYIGAQGSTALGSPNVMVNGAPLAFVAPVVGTSCSEVSIVPNACVLGFSNVFVGVKTEDLVRGLAVNAARAGIQSGVQAMFQQLTAEEEPSKEKASSKEKSSESDEPSSADSKAGDTQSEQAEHSAAESETKGEQNSGC